MTILGIDEVGRGCWAGPLVAGAVVFNDSTLIINGLTDSKLISAAKRIQLASEIERVAVATGSGWVSSAEVDDLGLTAAVSLAMQRAVIDLRSVLPAEIDKIVIDGNINYLPSYHQAKALVKADLTEPAVSAASIIAKVARDAWMADEAATDYPVYGFERHVGYGTKQHLIAMQLNGICPLHRKSFKPVRQFC